MQIENQLWRSLFDVFFAISSALRVIFFGAALGNVVRGVPWEWTIFSLSHCGRTSGLAPTPASSLGTPVARRFLRLSLLWSTERFTWRSRQKERCTKSRASLPADWCHC